MAPKRPSPTAKTRWAQQHTPQRPLKIPARLTEDEAKSLSSQMRERFKWDEEPRFFQVEGGKTTIMVCPLLALEDEMTDTFKTEFGLNALAVNSSTGRLTQKLVNDLIAGVYQILLISPEMLQSPSFINRVLRRPAFANRVLSVVVDEAHCVSHWGAGFRKKYGTLGVIRAFLPRGVSVIPLTATLTRRVERDLERVLHFPKSDKNCINVGNDRANVSIVVRACEHPQNSFADLDFIIPDIVNGREDIPKTYIYVDDINIGNLIIDHLNEILATRCPDLVAAGIIRPFNATLSHSYRRDTMAAFRANPPTTVEATSSNATESIRILVCTDAAGMGCNVRDVDLVVQWKLPKTLTHFVQRAGRAARARDQQGLAILIAERSAYSVNLQPPAAEGISTTSTRSASGQSKGKNAATKRTTSKGKLPKEYAAQHGLLRGASNKQDNFPGGGEEAFHDPDADDEGLTAFVQARTCRRAIWASSFRSALAPRPDNVPCCDICSPSLLDRTRPRPKVSPPKPRMRAKGHPDHTAQAALCAWRQRTFDERHRDSQLDASAILDDHLITALTTVGELTPPQVSQILSESWVWWTKYGTDLTRFVCTLHIKYTPIIKKASSKASIAVMLLMPDRDDSPSTHTSLKRPYPEDNTRRGVSNAPNANADDAACNPIVHSKRARVFAPGDLNLTVPGVQGWHHNISHAGFYAPTPSSIRTQVSQPPCPSTFSSIQPAVPARLQPWPPSTSTSMPRQPSVGIQETPPRSLPPNPYAHAPSSTTLPPNRHAPHHSVSTTPHSIHRTAPQGVPYDFAYREPHLAYHSSPAYHPSLANFGYAVPTANTLSRGEPPYNSTSSPTLYTDHQHQHIFQPHGGTQTVPAPPPPPPPPLPGPSTLPYSKDTPWPSWP
uniref:DNA 3'-5' helicase n=1 Tax=Ganoderma boninense TaxID=34458 RepID=A0A5K1JWX6_9APHY|nr:ATP-dependent RNA helicase mak5 (EC [Ganoderma boninense]